jgi:hypothetical protein
LWRVWRGGGSQETNETWRQSQTNTEFDSLIGLGAQAEAKPAPKETPTELLEGEHA